MQWLFALEICRVYLSWNLPQLFTVRICLGYLSWKFAVATCRSYFPWVFAVGLFCVCKQTFFVCEWIFFLCKETFLNGEQTFFIWKQNFSSFMIISFLTVFPFLIAVVVMGHRTQTLPNVNVFFFEIKFLRKINIDRFSFLWQRNFAKLKSSWDGLKHTSYTFYLRMNNQITIVIKLGWLLSL